MSLYILHLRILFELVLLRGVLWWCLSMGLDLGVDLDQTCCWLTVLCFIGFCVLIFKCFPHIVFQYWPFFDAISFGYNIGLVGSWKGVSKNRNQIKPRFRMRNMLLSSLDSPLMLLIRKMTSSSARRTPTIMNTSCHK